MYHRLHHIIRYNKNSLFQRYKGNQIFLRYFSDDKKNQQKNIYHLPKNEEIYENLSEEEKIAKAFENTEKLLDVPAGNYESVYRRVLDSDEPISNLIYENDTAFDMDVVTDMKFKEFDQPYMKELIKEANFNEQHKDLELEKGYLEHGIDRPLLKENHPKKHRKKYKRKL